MRELDFPLVDLILPLLSSQIKVKPVSLPPFTALSVKYGTTTLCVPYVQLTLEFVDYSNLTRSFSLNFFHKCQSRLVLSKCPLSVYPVSRRTVSFLISCFGF